VVPAGLLEATGLDGGVAADATGVVKTCVEGGQSDGEVPHPTHSSSAAHSTARRDP
jgi:hypothetical protein